MGFGSEFRDNFHLESETAEIPEVMHFNYFVKLAKPVLALIFISIFKLLESCRC